MRKSYFITLLLAMVSLSGFCQLKVYSNGQIGIGTNTNEDYSNPLVTQQYRDTISRVRIFGDKTVMSGGRIAFGDSESVLAMNVMVGELGDTDTDQLWLHGKKGIYYTINNVAGDTIFYYDVDRGNYVQFNCDVKSSGLFIASDSRFKEDIKPVDDALGALNNLSAVSYRLKPRLTGNAPSTANSEKELRDQTAFNKFYESLKNDPQRYGFLAQEVQEVLPELVRTDDSGYMYVDYIGMIPLLVNAIKELNSELKSLKSGDVADGQTPQRIEQSSIGAVGAEAVVPSLSQNKPNPFTELTVINYTLPESVATANVYIYDMQGRQLLQVPANGRGASSVSISGSELPAGMYIYALIADGKEIDSKRMILTR